MRINIDKITVKARIRKEILKIDELSADMEKNGLISPIAVMALNGDDGGEYQLLAGLRRLKAAQSLGWTEIKVNVMEPADAEQVLRLEIAENELRESFTPSERVHFGELLEEIEKVKARERQLSGKKVTDLGLDRAQGQGDGGGEITRGRTNDIVAPKVGMSRAIYQRAKYLVHNAPSDVMEKVDNKEMSISTAYEQLRGKPKRERETDGLLIDERIPELVAANVPARREKVEEVDDTAVVIRAAVPKSTEPSLTEESDETVARFDVPNADAAESPAVEADEPESPVEKPAEPAPKESLPFASTPEAPAPALPTHQQPKKPTAKGRLEEKAMAALSPRERAAILSRKAFDEMSDQEKVTDLTRRLNDERFRADKAEQELARHKELLHNAITHRDDTIRNQQGQIEGLIADITRLENENTRLETALGAANAKNAELEGADND